MCAQRGAKSVNRGWAALDEVWLSRLMVYFNVPVNS
jgi:hypothetical protein